MKRHFLFAAIDNKPGGKAPLIGQATPEEITAWKKEHPGGIYAIEVSGHVVYFKNPDRHEMNSALSKAEKDAALDMFEELATITKLGGSDEPLKDDQMFFGLIQEIRTKMDGLKAKLVNL